MLAVISAIPFDLLLIQTVNGIVTGMILALVASGLTLIFGIMDVVNFAHGELFMLGAYVGVIVMVATGNFWLALIISFLVIALLGAVIQIVTLRPLIGAGAREPRKSARRRFASAISRFVSFSMYESLTRSIRTRSSSSTRVPSAATAPMPSSSCPGAPSLRATKTSSGAPSSAAIGAAIATPPRGIASTVTGSLVSSGIASSSSRARNFPASARSRKSTS